MGKEHEIVTRLKKEHKTAIQLIKSVFEEARKHLKLDNFISENKACFDEKSLSSFCRYEKAELVKFISHKLNEIAEKIIYFRDVTPKYIADEIGRMICEKEFSV